MYMMLVHILRHAALTICGVHEITVNRFVYIKYRLVLLLELNDNPLSLEPCGLSFFVTSAAQSAEYFADILRLGT